MLWPSVWTDESEHHIAQKCSDEARFEKQNVANQYRVFVLKSISKKVCLNLYCAQNGSSGFPAVSRPGK